MKGFHESLDVLVRGILLENEHMVLATDLFDDPAGRTY